MFFKGNKFLFVLKLVNAPLILFTIIACEYSLIKIKKF